MYDLLCQDYCFTTTYLEANSASNVEGMGKSGVFLKETPRCLILMCEDNELRVFATEPHTAHLYPELTVCISSICLLMPLAFSTLPHLGQAFRSVAIVVLTCILFLFSSLTPNSKNEKKIHLSQGQG